MRVGRTALAALVASIVAVPPAGAAELRSGDATLVAEEVEGEVCVVVRSPSRGRDDDCGKPPRLPYGAVAAGPGGAVGGAVPPEVATVEVLYRDGVRRPVPTTADGPRALFLDARPEGRAEAWFLRLLDAEGRLVGADEIGAPRPLTGPVRLTGWRHDGQGTRLEAYTRPAWAPTPTAPDRLLTTSCLSSLRRDGAGRTRQTTCAAAEPVLRPALQVFGGVDDANPRLLNDVARFRLAGRAGPDVRRLLVVLGDGRRVTVPVRPLPRALRSDDRWFRYDVPPRAAVRSIAVLAEGDRVLRRIRPRQAPAALREPGSGIFDLDVPLTFPAGPSTEAIAAPPGDPALRLDLRRLGEVLCVKVAGSARGEGCDLPPREDESPVLSIAEDDRGVIVGGVTTPGVARVEATDEFDADAPPVAVDTVPPAGGEPGVRAFVLRSPFPFTRLRLLDASGAAIASGGVDPGATATEDVPPARVILRARVGGRAVALRGEDRQVGCYAVADVDACSRRIAVMVPCRPRVTVAVVRLRGGIRDVEAYGPDGRRLRVRTLRREGVAVAGVGPRSGIGTIAYRTRGGRRTAVRLGRIPSAARQCGFRLVRGPA